MIHHRNPWPDLKQDRKWGSFLNDESVYVCIFKKTQRLIFLYQINPVLKWADCLKKAWPFSYIQLKIIGAITNRYDNIELDNLLKHDGIGQTNFANQSNLKD